MDALGKYWLNKVLQKHWGRFLFVQMFKYKRVKIEYYLNALQSFSEFRTTKFPPNTLQDILDTSLFCNENITFRGKSLFFKSFLLSGLRTIRDIWDEGILNS